MTKKHKISPLEEKYKKLAEVYLARYEDQSVRNIQILLAKGVIVEMESDLAFYHLNTPRTEKSENQLQRLNILRGVINEFSGIHSYNWQINQLLGDMHRENQGLRNEIKELKEAITEMMVMESLNDT